MSAAAFCFSGAADSLFVSITIRTAVFGTPAAWSAFFFGFGGQCHPFFRWMYTAQFATDEFFYGWNEKTIILTGKTYRCTTGPCSTGTPNAMDIIFGILGKGKIDHVIHIINMNTTPCNVGGNQHSDITRLKRF
jgi:hypothetical protein